MFKFVTTCPLKKDLLNPTKKRQPVFEIPCIDKMMYLDFAISDQKTDGTYIGISFVLDYKQTCSTWTAFKKKIKYLLKEMNHEPWVYPN